jgi:hypothetical protein
MPVIPAAWEAEIRRRIVQGILTNKCGVVSYIYNSSYTRGTGRRTKIQGHPGKKIQDPIRKITKAKKD